MSRWVTGASDAALRAAFVARGEHAPDLGLFFPEAEGAVGNGVTNDSAALQAAIDAASAAGGGRVVGRAGAVYGLGSTIQAKSKVILDGIHFHDLLGNRNLVRVDGTQDATIAGCIFTGTGTLGTAGRGAIYGLGTTTGPQRLKIVNNTFSGLGTCGIAMEGAVACVISGNSFRATAEHGIYLSTGCSDVIVANNTIQGQGTGGTTSPVDGIKLARAANIHLRNNVIDGTDGTVTTDGILFEFDTKDCSAVGNVVRNCSGVGIRVNAIGTGTAPATDIMILDNVVQDCGGAAIRCFGGSSVRLVDNTVRASAAQSILVATGTTNVDIRDNVLVQSGGFNCIDLTVTGATLSGNWVRQTGGGSGLVVRATSTDVTADGTNRIAAVANSAGTGARILTTVGNSATATTLGTLSRKIEAFDANGTSIGFVPVYTTIT